jgi:putative intracellular protease/amidase
MVISTAPGFMSLSDKQGNPIPVFYFDEVDIYNLDALVITGGEEEYVPGNALDKFLRRFDALDRVIGAVSGGTAVLSEAGLLTGVKIAIEDPLKARMSVQGAEVVLDRVFMDGKFVTASSRSEGLFVNMLIPAIVSYRESALIQE